MKVAIIGTVGVPANYGGFETLVDQLVRHNKSEDLQYAVYCSKKSYNDERWVYHGAKIEYVGLNANGVQSIMYDVISLIRASRKSDAVLILGVSGCAFLPIFRLFSKKRLIINIDGLEHRRDKWGKWTRRFLKFSEKQAIRYGDVIVTDNKGIADYVKNEYKKDSELIAYGGDHALQDVSELDVAGILKEYGLTQNNYSIAICRIEPENNVQTILEAFSHMPETNLVFIGNWDNSAYGQKLRKFYSEYSNIKMLSAIYDLKILNALRGNCMCYLHGHSAGGTNPSLVEAMFFAKPIIAFDCIYNRETTFNDAIYFCDDESLIVIMQKYYSEFCEMGNRMRKIAIQNYRWEIITQLYENLYKDYASVRDSSRGNKDGAACQRVSETYRQI